MPKLEFIEIEERAVSFLRTLDKRDVLSLNSHYSGDELVQEYSATYGETVLQTLELSSGAKSNFKTSFVIPYNSKDVSKLSYTNEYNSYTIKSNFNYHSNKYNTSFSNIGEAPSVYVEVSDIDNAKSFVGKNIKKELFSNRSAFLKPSNISIKRNICIGPSYDQGKINPLKDEFPLYVNLSIGNKKVSDVANVFDKERHYESMISTINVMQLQSETLNIRRDNLGEILNTNVVKVEDMISAMSPVGGLQDKIYLKNSSPIPNSISYLDKIDIISKINNLNIKILNFDDIIDGIECHNEIIFYKVEKYLGSISSGNLRQTFYVPVKQDITNLVDTQVIAGQTYVYNVSAFILVAGVEYRYEEGSSVSIFNNIKKTFKVFSKPQLKIFQVPLFSESILVTSHGTLQPQIKFLNNSNSENKIRIYMDSQEGEERRKYIAFSDGENSLPYTVDQEGHHVFSSNNEHIDYLIYRMRERPNKYSDFEDNLLHTITRNIYPNSAIFNDNVSFNRKYYYTFRTRSPFGLYSNPTPIYEVELIRDSDETKVIVNVVRLEQKLFQKQRNFKRFMQITPALQQTILTDLQEEFYSKQGIGVPGDPNKSISVRQYGLGKVEKSIWDRKFKIRVRSNDTGKMVDFNVKFKILKKENKENFS